MRCVRCVASKHAIKKIGAARIRASQEVATQRDSSRRAKIGVRLPSSCRACAIQFVPTCSARLLPKAIAGAFDLDEVQMKSCGASDPSVWLCDPNGFTHSDVRS